MTLKFYNGKAEETHYVFHCSVLAHSPWNGKFNLSSIQLVVFAYQTLHPSSPFFTRIVFSFFPCLLARRSQEQALGPSKLKQKPRPKGKGWNNSTQGFVWENLSGAVPNMAWTCSHLTFKSLATANTYWLQKLNADLKIKVTATWEKPHVGVIQRKHPQITNGLDCWELSCSYRSQIMEQRK